MTSNIGVNASLPNPSDRRRYLEVTKDGIPKNLQVPRIAENYTGVGGVTIIPNGSHSFNVLGVLTGVLTLNCTSVANYVNRSLMVTVLGGATQNVVVNFPPAGYNVRIKGSPGTVTTYTIAASVNNQSIVIDFRADGAFVSI